MKNKLLIPTTFMIVIVLSLLSLSMSAGKKTVGDLSNIPDEAMGVYPTNFMKDVVPKFKTNRPVIGNKQFFIYNTKVCVKTEFLNPFNTRITIYSQYVHNVLLTSI